MTDIEQLDNYNHDQEYKINDIRSMYLDASTYVLGEMIDKKNEIIELLEKIVEITDYGNNCYENDADKNASHDSLAVFGTILLGRDKLFGDEYLDTKRGMYLLEKSCALGSNLGLNELGIMYYMGCLGPVDYQKALHCFIKSYEEIIKRGYSLEGQGYSYLKYAVDMCVKNIRQ